MHGAPIPLDRLPGAFMLNCKAGAIHRRHVDPSRQVDVAELKSPRLKTLPRISTRRKRTCIQGVLSHGPSSQESKSCGPARDMFMKFPWEICLEIAQYLPSKDFYHLRLASRYMSQVFFDQQFWKTRFAPDGDRDFLTCLAERKSAGNDWLYLYRATSKRLSYDLQDRKRIWSQCQLLRDLITMTIPPKWGRVCQLRRYKDLGIFSRVRRQERLRRQSFYIPPSLTCIVVSLVRKGQCTWVTGLKFIAGNRILSLGYIIPGSAIFPNVKGFKGFEAAVTYSGIRALKIINNEGKASSWIGEIRDAGVTKLILQHRVAGLEAFFDVSRFHYTSVIVSDVCRTIEWSTWQSKAKTA